MQPISHCSAVIDLGCAGAAGIAITRTPLAALAEAGAPAPASARELAEAAEPSSAA